MPAWSDLASDVLEHITSFLALTDQHRFSAVCHNWRSIAKRKRHPPAPQLPWLVLGEDQKTKKLNFFNLSEQRLYSIDIPELYGHHIVSSSYGWLFTIDERVNGYLLNPFTRERFELPPFPSFFDDMTMTLNADEAVIESNGKCFTLTFQELQTTIVSKAILSHDPKENPDFTVIIMFGEVARPAIWRPCDTGWAIIDCPYPLSDVIWFEGKLYIYSFDVMFAVDVVGSNPKATKISTLVSGIFVPFWLYLVDFKGKLLLVERFGERLCRKSFVVSRVNLKEGALDGLDSVDNLALFVGNSSPLVVDPSGFPGCIPNGIYFTGVYSSLNRADDFGVYHVVEKTVKPFCPVNDVVSPREIKLVWFTPNLS